MHKRSASGFSLMRSNLWRDLPDETVQGLGAATMLGARLNNGCWWRCAGTPADR